MILAEMQSTQMEFTWQPTYLVAEMLKIKKRYFM